MTARKLREIWDETRIDFLSILSQKEIYQRIRCALSLGGNNVTGPTIIDEDTAHYDVQNQNNRYTAGIDVALTDNAGNYMVKIWTKRVNEARGLTDRLLSMSKIEVKQPALTRYQDKPEGREYDK